MVWCTLYINNDSKANMKRTNIYLTDEQHNRLTGLALTKGTSAADITRRAIDWYLDVTGYTHETMDMLERIHPEMTPERIVEWLMFRWRLSHEGKDYRNGDGSNQVIKMLEEVLTILRGTHDTDHG
jgi:predicted DNA-binding protein